MLQITPHHHLLLAVKPVDFRKGIDSLAALCKQTLQQDPFKGAFFIFTNKLRSRVKILVYDGKGFWLCTRRFSKGRLAWWPTHNDPSSTPDKIDPVSPPKSEPPYWISSWRPSNLT